MMIYRVRAVRPTCAPQHSPLRQSSRPPGGPEVTAASVPVSPERKLCGQRHFKEKPGM